MPIINIKFIEGVVATPDQKRQLIEKMTESFVSVVGEVVRPFTYVVIEETKLNDWGIAGRPMPDMEFLTGDSYAEMMSRSRAIMSLAMTEQPAASSVKAQVEDRLAVIRRWMEEGWNRGNYDVAYDVISPTMQVHGAGGQSVKMGPEGLIDLLKTWRAAFPDGYMTVEDMFVEGDVVVVRNSWHGRHLGDFYGIAPTGKWVDITSIGFDRVVDGKVVEGWGEVNMLGAMQQMGLMPAPGAS